MSLYGAREIKTEGFGGGLCLTLDPTELRPDQAAAAENVDLEEQYLRKRLGKVAYNASAPTANPVKGITAYYPPNGTARSLIIAANTKVYADLNQNASFGDAGEEIATISGSNPVDLVQYREKLFINDGVSAVQDWSGSGVAAPSGPPTAPAAPPTISALATQVEAFEDATIWVESPADGDITPSNAAATDNVVEGTYALKLQIEGGAGGVSYKWNSATHATIDLSKAQELSIQIKGNRRGAQVQVGIAANASVIDFAKFPILTISEKDVFTEYRIPLSSIAPASRTAVPEFGIRFVHGGGGNANAANPIKLYFDDCRAVGAFHTDKYFYYYTYCEIDAATNAVLRESNPYQVNGIRSPLKTGDAGTFDLDMPPVVSALRVAGVYTNASGITHIRIYRHRETGPFRLPRLIDTIANVSGTGPWTYDDTVSEATIAMEDRPELVSGKMAPPPANTYATDGARLIAGGVTVGGTYYPARSYLSKHGFPEEFGTVQQSDRIEPVPTDPGWFDLPTKDPIKVWLQHESQMICFTDRSIWSLQGSGWSSGQDGYSVEKRADVGLAAKNAVWQFERYIVFLSGDGLRVLAPDMSFEGSWDTWVVSEPVETVLRAIPAQYRGVCAIGLDERDRFIVSIVRAGQTVSDASFVFDPSRPGALERGFNRARPGWTYYTNFGFTCFAKLKRGYKTGAYEDQGQLLGGDTATAKAWYLHRSPADVELETDAGDAIAWNWTGAAFDAGQGRTLGWVTAEIEADTANGQTITGTPVLDGVASASTVTFTLGTIFRAWVKRCAAGVRARRNQLKLSGSHSVAIKIRSATVGVWRR